MNTAIIATNCPALKLLNRGKVRDMYAIPGHDDKLLMVATDRISAFDVIMAEPVPGKGRLLTAISLISLSESCNLSSASFEATPSIFIVWFGREIGRASCRERV